MALCTTHAEDVPETQKTGTVQHVRDYSARVEWHHLSDEAEVPRQVDKPLEIRDLLPEDESVDILSPELMRYYGKTDYRLRAQQLAPLYYELIPHELIQQRTPRLRARGEQKKLRNWLVLDVEERKKEGKVSRERANVEKENVQMGWGWLADNVFRQQAEEAELAKEENDAALEEQLTASILKTEELRRRASEMSPGLLVTVDSTADRPMITPMKPGFDAQEQQVLSKLAVDDGRPAGSQGATPIKEVRVARTQVSESSALPESFGNAQMPTRAPMRDTMALPAEVLPQTAALLSKPRVGEAAASPKSTPTSRSLFEATSPKPAFDLSMPKADLSRSAFAPIGSELGARVERSEFFSFSGLSPTPSPSAGPLEQRGGGWGSSGLPGLSRPTFESPKPVFPATPSWRQ